MMVRTLICMLACSIAARSSASDSLVHFTANLFTEVQSNFNKPRNNWVNLLMLGADANTQALGWDNGMLSIHTNSFHKLADHFVANNWQGVSGIEERNLALGISVLAYSHTLHRVQLSLGLRNVNFDYLQVPYNDLFAGASPWLYPSLWSNIPLSGMPLSAMALHTKYQLNEQMRIQGSIYNGVSYDVRMSGFASSFTIDPAQDGIIGIAELDYKGSRGTYQLGAILRPWGRTIAQSMGYNRNSDKYVEHELHGGAWALWTLVQHRLYEGLHRQAGLVFQGSMAPFRNSNCPWFYGLGAYLEGVFNTAKSDQLGLYFNTAHFSTLVERIVELTWVYPIGGHIYVQPAFQHINSGGETANVGLLRLGFTWQ